MPFRLPLTPARSARLAAVILGALAPSTGWAQTTNPDGNGVPAGSLTSERPVDAARKALADKGVTYGVNYESQWQSNVAGGVRRGSIYVGRLEGILDIDFEKRAGLKGLNFHTNVYNIHGNSLTPNYVGSLAPTSFIEAKATTRLFELWLEQKFFGGVAALRAGQLAADTEFFTSGYASQMINGTFGWAVPAASGLPSGGPAYPLATPGVRLKLDPNPNASLLVGVFNGDPAGPGTNDPQIRNRYGLNFRLQDRPLAMTEGQLRVNQEKTDTGLAGSYKLGAFQHFGSFDDQRIGTDGLSLADPSSNGLAASKRGNSGVYGVIDQQLWRPKGAEADKGIGVFVRGMVLPSDRNLVDAYVDGGIVLSGLWKVRPDDILSFGAAYSKISGGARGLDADTVRFNGSGLVRSAERVFEINYQAQIMPGWQLDLDIQRLMNPSGGVAHPNDATGTSAIPSATVLTLSNSFKY